MTLLFFANGETFAAGALPLKYGPATETETTNRIVIPIEIQGIRTGAVVDTGAPYVICAPKVAADAGIDIFKAFLARVKPGILQKPGFLGLSACNMPVLACPETRLAKNRVSVGPETRLAKNRVSVGPETRLAKNRVSVGPETRLAKNRVSY